MISPYLHKNVSEFLYEGNYYFIENVKVSDLDILPFIVDKKVSIGQ